jgi:hypothetical protein
LPRCNISDQRRRAERGWHQSAIPLRFYSCIRRGVYWPVYPKNNQGMAGTILFNVDSSQVLAGAGWARTGGGVR